MQNEIKEKIETLDSDSEMIDSSDIEQKDNNETSSTRKYKPLVEAHEYTNDDEQYAENILSYYTPLDPPTRKSLPLLLPFTNEEINEFLQQK